MRVATLPGAALGKSSAGGGIFFLRADMSNCIPPQPDPFADPSLKPNPTCPVCTFPLLCVMCTGARSINADGTAEPDPVFILSEEDMRAIVRQTLHQYIPTEGTSGPVLHALLKRIRDHVGNSRYNEFCAEPGRTPAPPAKNPL